MWKPVEDKMPRKTQHTCLVAYWKNKNISFHYEVLAHHPDGTWTDLLENEIEHGETPDFWTEIPPMIGV